MDNIPEAGYRLSSQQQRLWSLTGAEDRAHVRAVVEVDGPLDADAVSRGLEAIARRYEVLRTRVCRPNGRPAPIQIIDETPLIRVVSAAGGEEACSDDRSPHLEATIEENGRRTRLHLSAPADIADVPTLRMVLRELLDGAAPDAGEEVLQYADLAEWLHELLTEEPGVEWEGTTAECVSPGPPAEVAADARLPLDELRSAASALGVDPRSLLLAAWAMALRRATGRAEALIGVEVDGRAYEELALATGPLARLLPLRVAMEPAITFAGLAARVDADLSGLEEQQYSFPADYPGGATLALPVAFSYQEATGGTTPSGLAWRLVDVRSSAEGSPLRLRAVEQGDFVSLELDVGEGAPLLPLPGVLLDTCVTLLRSGVRDPELPVDDLSAGMPAVPAAARPDGNARLVPALFDQAVARNPERPALRFRGKERSYRALSVAADRIATRLLAEGVRPDERVGVLLPRCPEAVAAILGTMKAGGAYVALDPSYPPERLETVAMDAGIRALVARRGDLPFQPECPVVAVDDSVWSPRNAAEPPEAEIRADALAYVIFTSGSTGRPKGVAIEHRSLAEYVQGVSERLRLQPGASFGLVSTLSADLGHTALFPTLCGEGTLELVDEETAADAQALAEHLSRHPVDYLKIVPAHLAALLQHAGPDSLPRTCLVSGGDTLSWPLVESVRRLRPDLRILNHYGPTETTVGVLTYEVGPEPEPFATAVPIGRPLAGVTVRIMSAGKQPAPPGCPGELFIAGPCVARGYLGDETLTAARFFVDPALNGRRYYRTGDLVRELPSGAIEFLGRTDDQVKIRGYRIEPAEVAGVLRRVDGVRDCAVVPCDDGRGEKRLVGYVVAWPGADLTAASLRERMAASLPGPMIPSAFAFLPALPLTANGKVDRQALPPPEAASDASAALYVAPRNAIETVVASIWEEILGCSRISVDGNFFDLGGHSLMATQVIARVRSSLQVEVPLRALFATPTVAGIAAAAAGSGETRERVERTAELVLRLAEMSDEEVEAMLRAREGSPSVA